MNNRHYLPLIARILMSTIFIISGINKITGWGAMTGYISSMGLPFAPLLLFGAIVIELVAGIALLVGYRVELAAGILFIYLIPTTLIFHSFWTAEAAQQQNQMIHFLKNLAIMGGLLQVMWSGSGAYSVGESERKAEVAA